MYDTPTMRGDNQRGEVIRHRGMVRGREAEDDASYQHLSDNGLWGRHCALLTYTVYMAVAHQLRNMNCRERVGLRCSNKT